MQLNAELLARDRNHPSVFMWSICNESGFGYGFQRSAEWVKAADPTRPRGGSYQASMDLDIRHNPISVTLIEEAERTGKKPILWDESFGIFQGAFYDHSDLYLDPGIRDYYIEPMIDLYRKFAESKVVQGSQIWAWADDMFCPPNMCRENGRGWIPGHFSEEMYDIAGRGVCGDAPWGVVDSWRRRKPEFWILKKLHSPVKLKDIPIPVPEAGQPICIPGSESLRFYRFVGTQDRLATRNAEGRSEGIRRTAIRRRTHDRCWHSENERRSGDRFPRSEGDSGGQLSIALWQADGNACPARARDIPVADQNL